MTQARNAVKAFYLKYPDVAKTLLGEAWPVKGEGESKGNYDARVKAFNESAGPFFEALDLHRGNEEVWAVLVRVCLCVCMYACMHPFPHSLARPLTHFPHCPRSTSHLPTATALLRRGARHAGLPEK